MNRILYCRFFRCLLRAEGKIALAIQSQSVMDESGCALFALESMRLWQVKLCILMLSSQQSYASARLHDIQRCQSAVRFILYYLPLAIGGPSVIVVSNCTKEWGQVSYTTWHTFGHEYTQSDTESDKLNQLIPEPISKWIWDKSITLVACESLGKSMKIICCEHLNWHLWAAWIVCSTKKHSSCLCSIPLPCVSHFCCLGFSISQCSAPWLTADVGNLSSYLACYKPSLGLASVLRCICEEFTNSDCRLPIKQQSGSGLGVLLARTKICWCVEDSPKYYLEYYLKTDY